MSSILWRPTRSELSCGEDNLEMEEASRILGEEWYSIAKANFKNFITPPTVPFSRTSTTTSASLPLPKLQLPIFSGDATERLTFYDAFRSPLNDNASLSDEQKLQYLRNRLKEEALELVSSLALSSCRICQRRHHTLLHGSLNSQPTEPANISSHYAESERVILLATAEALLKDYAYRWQPARALLDNGCFITEACVQRLHLPRISSSIRVTGIGWIEGGHAKGEVKSGPLDILIGMDKMEKVLLNGLRKGQNGTHMAQNTTLGRVLFGNTNPSKRQPSVSTLYCDTQLSELFTKVWELDELSSRKL
ncbi:unnamed protein product [Ceratitis capitata]|uniref:(Mediterranean fruit fly) hypothetical protein n=1 Tax=Ceratitis capitata TaxID=7213 RepID=A0A811URW8_CERCA|nr:unnamed protein product [Ceratitis capitata]